MEQYFLVLPEFSGKEDNLARYLQIFETFFPKSSVLFPSQNFRKFRLNGSLFVNVTVFEISEHSSPKIFLPSDSAPELLEILVRLFKVHFALLCDNKLLL